jgi:acetylornithine deacetylase
VSPVVDHLQNLVRLPSVSSMPNRPVIEYAEKFLRSKEWNTRRVTYLDACGTEKINLIAAPPHQDAATRDVNLAFFCHSDTVPFSADWPQATDPYVKDGNLHGCGACDVKGFLACLLAAAGQIEPAQFLDGLRIVLTADEEIGCIGAAKLIEADSIRPRRAVIGEPTSLSVARAGKGYCLAKVTISGKEAHSAHPDKGASAIYAAARLVSAIEEFSSELMQERHSFFEPAFTTINIGTIHGGTAKNIVPGQCEFLLEWRPIPRQSPARVLDTVHQIIEKSKLADRRFDYDIRVLRSQPGFEIPEDARLVSSIRQFTGLPSTSIPFASEASLLSVIAEEVVVVGPGDMRSAHSNREHVPLRELDRAVTLVAELMRRS